PDDGDPRRPRLDHRRDHRRDPADAAPRGAAPPERRRLPDADLRRHPAGDGAVPAAGHHGLEGALGHPAVPPPLAARRPRAADRDVRGGSAVVTNQATQATELLVTDQLGISFGGLRAVDNVQLKVRKGEIVGLIGPNGAGKTTCFNMITGVYKPTTGQVR